MDFGSTIYLQLLEPSSEIRMMALLHLHYTMRLHQNEHCMGLTYQ